MIPHPDLIRAALTADALNLGPHWVYDQEALAAAYPEGIDELSDPISPYHPDKTAGDFTHYGDNLALMLRSVSEEGSWKPAAFVSAWQHFWSDTTSYTDGATRETLARLKDESLTPSTSSDLAGASMALALVALIVDRDEAKILNAVRDQTGFAHRDAETIDAAVFFARCLLLIMKGQSLAAALDSAAAADYQTLNAASELEKARNALAAADHLRIATDFGLTCHTADAFPLVLYYLLRHPDNVSTALSENALAGGDNAARALIIAIILTAANGWTPTQQRQWLSVRQQPALDEAIGS